MRKIYLSFLLVSFVVISPNALLSQSDQTESDESENSEKVVRMVRFTGNSAVSNLSLKTLVRTRTNREFLGIRRFTPWYYTWQLFGVGEEPRYLDREVVANDIERIQLYYENIGYFDTEVDTTIIEYRPNRMEVSFLIREGPMSRINTVSYTGLPSFEQESTLTDFYRRSIYSSSMLNDSTFSYNGNYLVQELREEQSRIINFLKDRGFASVQRDSIRALVKPQQEDPTQLDILFTINHGKTYSFGDVFINLKGSEEQDTFDETKTEQGTPFTSSGTVIELQKESSSQTKFDLLTEQIQFTPGETFNQSAYLRTIRSFQNLGNMTITRFGLNEQNSQPDYESEDIPVYFDLQTLPKHSIRTEFFGMRRYGFGTGAGVNYNNNNLFGRAENFSLGINTNFEFVPSATINEIAPQDTTGKRTSSGAAIFQSYEVMAEYLVPRLNFPFHLLSGQPWIESGRTRYTLTYSQSDQLFFDINTDIRFNLRYEFRHSDRLTSFFDLLELDIVDTDPSSQFRQNLIDEFGEGSFELLRIEQDFDPQFSSIIRYTFRSQNTDLIKRNYGYFGEYSIALAGNIPYVLDRFVVTPGKLEQTLPSPFGISSNSLSYSRYIKLSADYRRYIPLSQNTVLALRGFGGIAHPISNSETIPLNRRFFAGGSNDIRGWNSYRLGPGSISPEDISIHGGEIKLAMFSELRQTFIRDVFGAQWDVAWHTDAGNIWYGPKNSFRNEDNQDLLQDGKFFLDSFYNQIAIGSGLGLRLDWEFIVARFDLTLRVNDPTKGWFEDKTAYFSFGIGHSF